MEIIQVYAKRASTVGDRLIADYKKKSIRADKSVTYARHTLNTHA